MCTRGDYDPFAEESIFAAYLTERSERHFTGLNWFDRLESSTQGDMTALKKEGTIKEDGGENEEREEGRGDVSIPNPQKPPTRHTEATYLA